MSDELIEQAVEEIAKALFLRGLTAAQVGARLRDEVNKVEADLTKGDSGTTSH